MLKIVAVIIKNIDCSNLNISYRRLKALKY